MKILLIHFKFFEDGGPEKYLFNIRSYLKLQGHEVVDFSINFDRNENSFFKEYFPTLQTGTEEFHLNKLNLSFLQKIGVFSKHVYNYRIKKSLENLIQDTKPDIAYVLSFKGKLSISIFDALNKKNIPVVHRISDFSLLCLKNIYYRNGEVCRKCDKTMLNGLIYKCEGKSFLRTLSSFLSLQLFYLFNKQQKVNTIVCPSNSTVKLFEQNKRFKNNRIIHIPTFVKEVNKTIIDNIDVRTRFKNKCFAFWGRVDEDKGVEVFVKAILYLKNNNFDIKAKIFGFTDNEYSYSLLDFINKNNLQNIEVYPFLEKTELMEKISFCTGSILPSLWYDNMPNSLIESQSLGIPVIASEIGCFPELIDTENGLTFETNNHIDLAAKIKELIFSEVKYQKYVENSLLWSSNYCTVESHYNSLMKEFENIKKNDYK